MGKLVTARSEILKNNSLNILPYLPNHTARKVFSSALSVANEAPYWWHTEA